MFWWVCCLIIFDAYNEAAVPPGGRCYSIQRKLTNLVQVLFLISSEFKPITELLFPLKSSENCRFSGDFKGNGLELICLNSLNSSRPFHYRKLY